MVFGKACQLEEGVDGHRLDARGCINLILRNFGKDLGSEAIRAGIPVMDRTSDQRAAFTDQRKVHTPGVYAHRFKSAILGCKPDCITNFLNESGGIPEKRVTDFDGAIWKAVDDIEGELSIIGQRPNNAAATLSSEVNRKYSCHPIPSASNHVQSHYPPS